MVSLRECCSHPYISSGPKVIERHSGEVEIHVKVPLTLVETRFHLLGLIPTPHLINSSVNLIKIHSS